MDSWNVAGGEVADLSMSRSRLVFIAPATDERSELGSLFAVESWC